MRRRYFRSGKPVVPDLAKSVHLLPCRSGGVPPE